MEIMVTEGERDLILAALHDLIKKAERNQVFIIGAEKRRAWKAEVQVARELLGRLLSDKAVESVPTKASALRFIRRSQ
jgi:hypothetical protein